MGDLRQNQTLIEKVDSRNPESFRTAFRTTGGFGETSLNNELAKRTGLTEASFENTHENKK